VNGVVRSASVALLLTAWGGAPALGQDAPVSPGDSSPVTETKPLAQVHGFLLGLLTGRTTGNAQSGTEGSDIAVGEERLRLELRAASASGDTFFVAKGDLFHDAVGRRVAVDLREAYAGYTTSGFDLRIGRQIVTWGVGDLFFVTDVFPKDWESFFGGRPAEYLKQGVDGARARLSMGRVNAEIAVIPFFTPDVLPSPGRFGVTDPFASVPNQVETKPAARTSSTEIALRLLGRLAGFDLSIAAYRGFWRTPGARLDDTSAPTTVTLFYPRLSVYGLSAQRNALDGVLSLETGYYRTASAAPRDRGGLPGSQWRFLIGYQRQLWKDSAVGLQLYGELVGDEDAAAAASGVGRLRRVISLRLTQLLGYETWKLSLFVAFSPTDEDGFVRPEVSFKVSDELGVTVGANVFGGASETTFFGRLRRSDNAFVAARFDF